uniref:Uncharacterized protein n=1 Tax=Anguilla anguilla TaxID=7936 RepID=A0A0E9T6L9_ANGAN
MYFRVFFYYSYFSGMYFIMSYSQILAPVLNSDPKKKS